MPETRKTQSRAQRRAAQRRRQRQRRVTALAAASVAIVLAIALFLALRTGNGSGGDTAVVPTPEAPASEVSVPSASPTAMPAPTDAPVPTSEPTPSPTPSPRPTPEGMPNVVSFYTPKGKSYSPRVRMGDTFPARWKRGEDIGSFEVIASDAQELDGSFFGDIFGAAWRAFPGSDGCKIGYTLRYTLDDGSEIRYTMLSPKHIEHTEFIECWLYDDYHREPHQFYSHLKGVKGDTLMTSIKLTCGRQISRVQDIWLTAFICSSLDDFDAERNYTGDVSCTIHITQK